MSDAAAAPLIAVRHGVQKADPPGAGTADGALPPLMVMLTIVTGIVDAVAYLRLGHVFVANMTGNVVFLGFSAAGAGGLSVVGSLVAIACFLPGGVVAGRLAGRAGNRRLHQLRAATGIQFLLFAGAILVATAAGDHLGAQSRYALSFCSHSRWESRTPPLAGSRCQISRRPF